MGRCPGVAPKQRIGDQTKWVQINGLKTIFCPSVQFSPVQFSHSVMSDSLWSHGLQHARPPCPTPVPRVCSNSCPLSRWCHLILCCPFLFLPSIFLSIRVFSNKSVLLIRWPNYWSFTSASVLPMNIQDGFPLGWTNWISLQSKGLSRSISNTTVQKHQFFTAQLSLSPTFTSIHDYWKNYSFD